MKKLTTHLCFVVSSVYTIVLLSLYVVKRNASIPLTYRKSFNDWNAVQNVLRDHPIDNGMTLWPNISDIMWCSVSKDLTSRLRVSQQCSCVYNFLNTIYAQNIIHYYNNSETLAQIAANNEWITASYFLNTLQNLQNTSFKSFDANPRFYSTLISEFKETQAKSLLDSCLRTRSTWFKDTCSYCNVHLAVPVIIASLAMSVLLSRVAEFHSLTAQNIAYYFPILLALAVSGCIIGYDLVAGIPAALTAISILIEASYTCKCTDDINVYWSYQRFFIGAIAIWAAITQRARDVYLSASYGAMGFYIGLLAYTICLTRLKRSPLLMCSNSYAWLGVCAIAASFILLIQQNWYDSSPFYSSVVSVVCLMTACAQCMSLVPGMWYSETLQVLVGLVLLTVCFITVTCDLLSI